jgi:hypothetical protein
MQDSIENQLKAKRAGGMTQVREKTRILGLEGLKASTPSAQALELEDIIISNRLSSVETEWAHPPLMRETNAI